jgi:hypothetical protein
MIDVATDLLEDEPELNDWLDIPLDDDEEVPPASSPVTGH